MNELRTKIIVKIKDFFLKIFVSLLVMFGWIWFSIEMFWKSLKKNK